MANHLAKVAVRGQRKPVNVTLPESLLTEARTLGLNVSQACEAGLSAAVARTRAERWSEANGAALDEWNDYVAAHGIPLEEFRQF